MWMVGASSDKYLIIPRQSLALPNRCYKKLVKKKDCRPLLRKQEISKRPWLRNDEKEIEMY
jgi:hypothetical protein